MALTVRDVLARFALLALCALPDSAVGTPPATAVDAGAHPPRIHVVMGGDWKYPPFHYLDAQGEATGFDVDLFRAVAAYAGLGTAFRLGEWDQALLQLEQARIDVVPMFVTPERAQRFVFTQPFLHRYHLAFGRRGADYVAELEDLAGRRVAVQQAGLAWEVLAQVPDVQLVTVAVEHEALVAVDREAADYALVPMLIGFDAQRRHKLPDLVALSPPLLERPYAFAVAPRYAALVPRIEAGLEQALRQGTHDQLYRHWLGNLTPPGQTYRSGLMLGLWVALPLLGIAVFALVWWRRARALAAAESVSREQAEAHAHFLAFHDPVTGLPNRNALRGQLAGSLAADSRYAVVRVDLLDLGSIEAIAGQEVVDRMLRAVAARLQRELGSRHVASVGRRGFAVVALGVADVPQASALMQAAIDAVQARVEIAALPLEPRCRAGVAVAPEHGSDVDAVLRAAAMACSAAHESGLRAVVYTPALEPDARNLTLLGELREAIREGGLGYAVQPKLELASGRWVGAEMLVRWEHPRHGPLRPDAFVPLAEKTGVIAEMSMFMVQRAAAECRAWRGEGLALSLSVNLSVNDLADEALVDGIIAACSDLGGCLMLEVTETDAMRDGERVLASVARLRACGIGISLDDFGTGHSSLTYLRRLSPDELKIDRSFVSGLLRSRADQSIVRSLIPLAHSLGAKVTAEGVEDDATLQWLTRAGCDMAQGFGIARPIPVAEFLRRLPGTGPPSVHPRSS